MADHPYDMLAAEVRGLGDKIERMDGCMAQIAERVDDHGTRLKAVEDWQEASNARVEKFWKEHFPALLRKVDGVEKKTDAMIKIAGAQAHEIRSLSNRLSILVIAGTIFLAMVLR